MGSEKANVPSHPHANHRERVRNLFLTSGLDGFSDHNMLELLLFYAIPKGDTNVTAHNLIAQFGSLRNVLDASPEELCKVKGVGMYTATFLSILPQLARRYSEEQLPQPIRCTDTEAVQAFLRARFIGESSECVYLLSFSSDGQKTACIKVSAGIPTAVAFSERVILAAAFRTGASSVILAHNHPGGIAAPSNQDIDVTYLLADALMRCEIRLADHIIVAGNDSFSMASHKRYRGFFGYKEEE